MAYTIFLTLFELSLRAVENSHRKFIKENRIIVLLQNVSKVNLMRRLQSKLLLLFELNQQPVCPFLPLSTALLNAQLLGVAPTFLVSPLKLSAQN